MPKWNRSEASPGQRRTLNVTFMVGGFAAGAAAEEEGRGESRRADSMGKRSQRKRSKGGSVVRCRRREAKDEGAR